MKWKLFFCSLIFFSIQSIAQVWELEKEWSLTDTKQQWVLDEWGQLYLWKDNSISVRNEQTGQLFQESFKNFGEITGVYPLNGLRSLIFSEEQQMIGVLDNTLQLQRTSLNLSELGLEFVTAIAKSSRPDFIWLFDQYRQRLILFNINTAQAVQIIDNCFGGSKDLQLVQFFEYQQNLICHLSDGRFFEFDRNLTLVKKLTLAPNLHLFGYQNELWQQEQNRIEKLGPSIQSSPIELPATNYQELQVLQDRFYFQQGQKISVYRLKL
ncbi:MAG: hypothetical protein RLZZ289_1452 [Bacteroidota bacterium]